MKNNIMIDLTAMKNRYSGLGQVGLHYGTYLAKYNTSFDLTYLVPKNSNAFFSPVNVRLKYKNPVIKKFPVLQNKYSLWHSLDQLSKYKPPKGVKRLITVHDLNFLQEENTQKAAKMLKVLSENLSKVEGIVYISNYAEGICEKYIPVARHKKSWVVYNGVADDSNKVRQKPKSLDSLKQPYLLSVGEMKPKKNLGSIIKMMSHLPKYQLVIAGNQQKEHFEELKNLVKDFNLNRSIIFAGPVCPEEKNYLFANCTAFLFPSYLEGFGLPLIEAMHFYKPVFATMFTALPEIGKHYAFYFKGFEASEMAEVIKEGIGNFTSDQAVKAKEYAFTFNWKNTTNQYLNIYKEILNVKFE